MIFPPTKGKYYEGESIPGFHNGFLLKSNGAEQEIMHKHMVASLAYVAILVYSNA